MSPGRWREIEQLFHEAGALAPAERATFLDRACAGDEALRREVELLLAADAPEDSLVPAAIQQALVQFPAQSEEPAGKRIGRYSITGLIGKGGMGAVYRAVREDDFRMEVAIKLLNWGGGIEVAAARFRAERQILASLQHPNIARLLDGGTTETGSPYLVMEYVDGVPLLEYTAPLPIRRRLELFRSVCSAVEYAHQHQIIHRDIKPANILVTADGIPKLLDFGIAKLLDPLVPQELAPTVTGTGVRLMTPDYASPEQARGQSVTASTDIYSLGVVLCELLTGRRSLRSATGPRLKPDLESIVRKTLEQYPDDRYASSGELSGDLGRFLEDRLMRAHRQTFAYRGSKFMERNRASVIAATLSAVLVLAVLAGLDRFERPSASSGTAVRSLAVLPLEKTPGTANKSTLPTELPMP